METNDSLEGLGQGAVEVGSSIDFSSEGTPAYTPTQKIEVQAEAEQQSEPQSLPDSSEVTKSQVIPEISTKPMNIPASFCDDYPVELDARIENDIRPQFETSQEEMKDLVSTYLPGLKEYYLSPGGYKAILKVLNTDGKYTKWDLSVVDIVPILGKMLIPDSIKPTLENAKLLADRLSATMGDQDKAILEVCTGAGISAMMTWKEMKKNNPEKACSILSIDKAQQSHMVAYTLLKLQGVPVRWVTREMLEKGNEMLDSNTGKDFDGVSLITCEAEPLIEYLGEDGRKRKYDGIVSDHGINYFTNQLHEVVVGQLIPMVADRGILQLCALENDTKVALDYKAMIGYILSREDLLKKFEEIDKPYEIEKVQVEKEDKNRGKYFEEMNYIKAIYSQESAGLYMMLRQMLGNFRFGLFGKYVNTIREVAGATDKLASSVKSPIAETVRVLQKIDENIKPEIYPLYDPQKPVIARSLFYTKP